MALRRKLAAALCLTIGSLIVLAQETKTPAASRTLVQAGHLLDVKMGKLLDAQTIVVTGDTISSVGATASVKAQPGDTVIDLGSMTVMPGLIDVHTHITGQPNFDPYFELTATLVVLLGDVTQLDNRFQALEGQFDLPPQPVTF
jgi:predicted amidohydrolase YtcJ